MLNVMSRWNDRAQAFLFGPEALAPTYAESEVVHDFRYNAFFPAPTRRHSPPPITASSCRG